MNKYLEKIAQVIEKSAKTDDKKKPLSTDSKAWRIYGRSAAGELAGEGIGGIVGYAVGHKALEGRGRASILRKSRYGKALGLASALGGAEIGQMTGGLIGGKAGIKSGLKKHYDAK